MPTNRKRITRNRRRLPVEDWRVEYLKTGELPDDTRAEAEDINPFEILEWEFHVCRWDELQEPVRLLWNERREAILPAWIRDHPGTRPYAWWAYDAPRWDDGDPWHARYAEPRRRIGEAHTSHHAVSKYPLSSSFGVPNQSADSTSMFESEAEYLARHGLLTDFERRRLDI